MGIHAKSLNQLAKELEARHRVIPTAQEPQQIPAPAAVSNLATELAEFRKFVTGLCQKPPAQQVQKSEAPKDDPTPAEREVTAPGFYMDTTLGTRTRPAHAAQARKGEAGIRFYPGFASRADITGEE